MLAVEFARFYGLEFSARANMPDIVNAVCATAANTAVELMLVDEIHNLNLATRDAPAAPPGTPAAPSGNCSRPTTSTAPPARQPGPPPASRRPGEPCRPFAGDSSA
jgi:hypothetical protein